MATLNPEQQIQRKFWNGCLVYAEEDGMWLKYDDYMNFLSIRGEIDR